ncbi:MAG: UDP-N-acetylmuramate dehydrogenase [Bacteroidetes bacterium]|nr:UDP-N-acetylmuramate dehydrogenase [Bacteroidota bacterium]
MIEKNISLKSSNTFGFDIQADLYAEIRDINTLLSIWKTNLLVQSSPLILGGGSNILFTDNYHGLVLRNSLLGKSVIQDAGDAVIVELAGGENWHQSVLWAIEQGFGGIENLSLIPGSVGAAPIQNIGAYGVELEQVFHQLHAFDFWEGKMVVLHHSECRFGYRDSLFKREGKGRYFITSVELKLHRNHVPNLSYGDIPKTLETMGIQNPGISDVSRAVIQIRQSKLPDPAVIGNCGSFFKNPVVPVSKYEELKVSYPEIRSFPVNTEVVKIPAAWLIESCNWKGFRRGDAGVHEKQALVLVNYGNAKGNEIRSLAFEIQESVNQRFGIELEMEVNIR